jgi:hypothetical protein
VKRLCEVIKLGQNLARGGGGAGHGFLSTMAESLRDRERLWSLTYWTKRTSDGLCEPICVPHPIFFIIYLFRVLSYQGAFWC